MKFDLDTAWKDTMGLLSRNFGLLAVLAGVFFFLPYAGFMIAVPEMGAMQSAQAGGDFEVVMAAVTELYLEYWWVFLLLALIQGVGLLGMLALVRRRANPTVGEALATGARSVPSYIAAQLLQTAPHAVAEGYVQSRLIRDRGRLPGAVAGLDTGAILSRLSSPA